MDDHHHSYCGESGAYDSVLYLSREQRFEHILALGATGVGKSTFMRGLAEQDILRGDGMLYIDPHGRDADALIDRIPPERRNHVAYLDFSDLSHAIGLNVFEDTPADDRALAADALVSALRDIWASSWGARMETITRQAALALIEAPRTSFALLPRFLTDDEFRAAVLHHVRDPFVCDFFGRRFAAWRDAYRTEAIEPLLNKVDAFLSFPAIRNVLGQATSTLHLDHAMNEGRIVICNLAKGSLGDTGAQLAGALLIARIRTAAMARARLAPEAMRDFHLYVDEAQNFATDSLPKIAAETRKYRVSLTLATQFLGGLTEITQEALLGTVGTFVSFRVGPNDADIAARRFQPLHGEFNAAALQQIGRGEAYMRVADGDARLVTTPAPSPPLHSAASVLRQSQRHYEVARKKIESDLFKVLGV